MAYKDMFKDFSLEQMEMLSEPMSDNVHKLFPEFTACDGRTGHTLLYSPDSQTLEIAPSWVKSPAICWHVKTGGNFVRWEVSSCILCYYDFLHRTYLWRPN